MFAGIWYNSCRFRVKGGVCVECIVDGKRVTYIDEGTGPVVLLLHGWGAPAETYRLIIDHLSAYCRVIAPDLPGFGGSDEPDAPWCVDEYVDFVLAFAEALHIRQAVLMGHSNGGRIIHTLMNRPERPLQVEKIVLIDAAGLKPRHGPGYYARVYSYKAGKWVLSLPGVRRLFPDAVEKLRAKKGSADYRSATPIMRQTMVRLVNEDLSGCLPGIQAPTLLIWGEKDTATPLEDGRRMEKAIPDAGLVVLAGAGHFSFAERWGQCSRVLDAFLK